MNIIRNRHRMAVSAAALFLLAGIAVLIPYSLAQEVAEEADDKMTKESLGALDEKAGLPLFIGTDLLGMTPRQAYNRLGAPDEIFVHRGAEPWQDDAVFYFEKERLYLFWFEDRVWQVRLDGRSRDGIEGVLPGMTQSQVRDAIGEPWKDEGDSAYYNIVSEPYPVRMRLVFRDETVNDIYLYRSDF